MAMEFTKHHSESLHYLPSNLRRLSIACGLMDAAARR